jgi:hypothetical protein
MRSIDSKMAGDDLKDHVITGHFDCSLNAWQAIALYDPDKDIEIRDINIKFTEAVASAAKFIDFGTTTKSDYGYYTFATTATLGLTITIDPSATTAAGLGFTAPLTEGKLPKGTMFSAHNRYVNSAGQYAVSIRYRFIEDGPSEY